MSNSASASAPSSITPRPLSVDEWRAQAIQLFGADALKWRFVCPSCGHVAAVEDWKTAGATQSQAGFSCVGRYTGAGDSNTFKNAGGPCNYAGGGLIGLNPVQVIGEGDRITRMFAFADA